VTTLRAMPHEAFAAYLDTAVAGYAQESVAAGRWQPSGALERSRDDFLSLLPLGLDTPDNFVLEILQDEQGPVIGVVWYAIDRKYGMPTAYVFDLEIVAAHRRQGHALRALQAVERSAMAAGAVAIGLNVFADNPAAQALYRRIGYATTNCNMHKKLVVANG
jgi:ribosomal protein S18 acetylase RimI-like enzyme